MASIQIKIVPFSVPDVVTPEIPCAPTGVRGFDVSAVRRIPLSEISSEVLTEMCDDFRREVFKKAGYEI